VQEVTQVFGGITVAPGSVVVEAQIYNSIPHNPGWFEPPEWDPSMAYDLVWIQHVVRAVVPSRTSKQLGENQLYPAKPAYISAYNKEATAAFPLRKVAASMVESIREEIMLRDRLELEVEEDLVQQQPEEGVQQQYPQEGDHVGRQTDKDHDDDDNISTQQCGNESNDEDYKP
jgi:hypothetical protein